jgi:hypothetical protein
MARKESVLLAAHGRRQNVEWVFLLPETNYQFPIDDSKWKKTNVRTKKRTTTEESERHSWERVVCPFFQFHCDHQRLNQKGKHDDDTTTSAIRK